MGDNIPGASLMGGDFPAGNFLGGSFPDTEQIAGGYCYLLIISTYQWPHKEPKDKTSLLLEEADIKLVLHAYTYFEDPLASALAIYSSLEIIKFYY